MAFRQAAQQVSSHRVAQRGVTGRRGLAQGWAWLLRPLG